jgi:hypothetical protein
MMKPTAFFEKQKSRRSNPLPNPLMKTMKSNRTNGGLAFRFLTMLAFSRRPLEALRIELFRHQRPPVDFHGFVSQGFLYSSKYNYLGDSSRGSFLFTEAALNASFNPLSAHAHLRAGFHLRCGRGGQIMTWFWITRRLNILSTIISASARGASAGRRVLQRHSGRGCGADICAAAAGNL